MPAKKVTKAASRKAATLEKGIAKVKAANAAKRAKVAAKGRPGPKLLADLLNKPFREVAARKAAKRPGDNVSANVHTNAAPTKAERLADLKARKAAIAGAKAKPAKAGKAMPVATLAQIDKAQGVKRDTAEAKGVGSVSGSKATIIHMIETTKGGVSAAEIAKALGWPRAGGTISRAIKLATFKVAKVRDADGVLRYSRA